MRTENIYCDYCKKMTTSEGVKKEKLHGFLVELGYSLGGWGMRRDFVGAHTVELCNDCFCKVQKKSKELADTISECKRDRNKK